MKHCPYVCTSVQMILNVNDCTNMTSLKQSNGIFLNFYLFKGGTNSSGLESHLSTKKKKKK